MIFCGVQVILSMKQDNTALTQPKLQSNTAIGVRLHKEDCIVYFTKQSSQFLLHVL